MTVGPDWWGSVRPAARDLSAALGRYRVGHGAAVLVGPGRAMIDACAAVGPPDGQEVAWSNVIRAVADLVAAARADDREQVRFALRWVTTTLDDLARV